MAAMRIQASSSINFGSQKKVATPSMGVPLLQPLGFSRPQTATFAASGALMTGTNLLTSTIRKLPMKLDIADSEDAFGSFLGKRDKSEAAKPSFRSALEQVSYETNHSLASERPVKRRQGLGNRLAQMLRR